MLICLYEKISEMKIVRFFRGIWALYCNLKARKVNAQILEALHESGQISKKQRENMEDFSLDWIH